MQHIPPIATGAYGSAERVLVRVLRAGNMTHRKEEKKKAGQTAKVFHDEWV